MKLETEAFSLYQLGEPQRERAWTVPLCSEKTASKQILARLVTDARLGKPGLADVFGRHNRRPLAERLDDWRLSLTP